MRNVRCCCDIELLYQTVTSAEIAQAEILECFEIGFDTWKCGMTSLSFRDLKFINSRPAQIGILLLVLCQACFSRTKSCSFPPARRQKNPYVASAMYGFSSSIRRKITATYTTQHTWNSTWGMRVRMPRDIFYFRFQIWATGYVSPQNMNPWTLEPSP